MIGFIFFKRVKSSVGAILSRKERYTSEQNRRPRPTSRLRSLALRYQKGWPGARRFFGSTIAGPKVQRLLQNLCNSQSNLGTNVGATPGVEGSRAEVDLQKRALAEAPCKPWGKVFFGNRTASRGVLGVSDIVQIRQIIPIVCRDLTLRKLNYGVQYCFFGYAAGLISIYRNARHTKPFSKLSLRHSARFSPGNQFHNSIGNHYGYLCQAPSVFSNVTASATF